MKKFKDMLKAKRLEANMTQQQLADAAGMTARALQNYESGARRPRNDKIIDNLAKALHCTYDDLTGTGDTYIMQAQEKSGAKAARDVEELISEVSGLFAGGTLDEESMDGVYRALTQAYWDAKDRNKKYTPKKYRHDQSKD